MNPIYKKIINTCNDKIKNYKIIKDGFENVKIKNYYDLVFTSPPFLVEVYENTKKQSVKKFNTVEKWKNDFYFHQ